MISLYRRGNWQNLLVKDNTAGGILSFLRADKYAEDVDLEFLETAIKEGVDLFFIESEVDPEHGWEIVVRVYLTQKEAEDSMDSVPPSEE